ncbi:lytic murein transglycosylase [Rhodoplanes sp. Z2-YC6860]|uniref:lytic murein transglycosylase n=1 Tax=Rhodoplanes sp. Z2-YC6860 TaxID=674703 RepID=UPI00078BDCAF|nr:lytic murein transglycosylase [Rhodoplanes sp. Z2-YC6860]AMN40161.1 lytic murein transglycosylase [Rhodoplanes sp. Z2-YC6860]
MRQQRAWRAFGAAIAISVMLTGAADAAARCRNTGSFERWLEGFKQEAATQGISRQAISAALGGVTFDPNIIRRDSGQGVFQQSFQQFAGRMTGGGRYENGVRQLKANAALLARIEQQSGVPPAVVVALWGLESDYGAYKGGVYNIIRSVATLAYDCRRPDFFREELMGAVRIVERGDLKPQEMIGNWAGELGPTQFTPSQYFKYGVDFDGDGRVDMIHSTPDALASAANLMKSFGWQRGQPWLQEVRVPAEMPWQESGLENKHPRSQWVRWGVAATHGQLPADNLEASLILPMGRLGPAFLAYPNFKAYIEWNAAVVYSTTAAYFGTRLAGAPPFRSGNGQPVVPTTPQVQELQQLLIARKMLTGEADGRLGSATRAAVKQAQLKVGLPADAYPTQELIERLRAGR